MFDADGSYPALNGGGDIRFSSDVAGSTQLACEVVTFITNNNPALGSAEIWVKVPSVASATDTDIYVWYNKAGETQPAETDTYGKHNVWDSNFKLVQHMSQDPSDTAPQMIDSTSNSNDGTSAGAMTTSDLVDAKVGKGLDLDGSDDYISVGTSLGQQFVSAITLSAWVYIPSGATANDGLFHCGASGPTVPGFYSRILGNLSGQGPLFVLGNGTARDTRAFVTATPRDAWLLITLLTDGSTKKLYFDNDLKETFSLTIAGPFTPGMAEEAQIGVGYGTAEILEGKVDEVRISNIARSTDWITAEYNNQSDPGTFVVEGTPESVGGTDRFFLMF
jgi:hypothetical protein